MGYITCCMDIPRRDVDRLHNMIESGIDVTYRTLTKHVRVAELAEVFPYYAWGPGKPGELRLKNDWHVSYHRSRYKGKRVYYVRHSAIEYIFSDDKRGKS